MAQLIPVGHRGRGAGLSLDVRTDYEKALVNSRHKGQTFYVDSNATSGGQDGGSWGGACLTIDAAINKCLPGDTIFVAPRHAESISTAGAIAADVAGISIIGIGYGTHRPTITLTAVAASMTIGAASIRVSNILFLTTAACTIVLDVNSSDAMLDNLEFRRSSGTHPVIWIDINGGGANACDRTKIYNCLCNSGTGTGANEWIELGEVADGVEIRNCVCFGDFADACIHNPTGKVLTNLTISDCDLRNLQTGDHAIELVSACTGQLIRNTYFTDMAQTTGCDPGSCFSVECYQADVIDTSGILTPVVT